MTDLSTFDFARGFIASLVSQGADSIQPKSPEDRKGFRRVLETLDQEIADVKKQATSNDRQLYRALVSLKAELAPSNSGTYDSFEAALRNLQLSLTSCPNPFYEDIEFTVSSPFAESVLSEFSERTRQFIAKAAKSFLDARTSV